MTHPMLIWLESCLDAEARIALAAQEKALSPWRNSNGLVKHCGPPESGHGRDDGLWDDEGTSGMKVDHQLCMLGEVADHVALHDPAAVLADIAAKRAILDQHRFYLGGGAREQLCQTCGGEGVMNVVSWPCNTIRLVTSAYAHRDGFDPGWAVLDEVELW